MYMHFFECPYYKMPNTGVNDSCTALLSIIRFSDMCYVVSILVLVTIVALLLCVL